MEFGSYDQFFFNIILFIKNISHFRLILHTILQLFSFAMSYDHAAYMGTDLIPLYFKVFYNIQTLFSIFYIIM